MFEKLNTTSKAILVIFILAITTLIVSSAWNDMARTLFRSGEIFGNPLVSEIFYVIFVTILAGFILYFSIRTTNYMPAVII